jgi:hypothetical protein
MARLTTSDNVSLALTSRARVFLDSEACAASAVARLVCAREVVQLVAASVGAGQ